MNIKLSEREVEAVVKAFRLTVSENTEKPGVVKVKLYEADFKVVERLAGRLARKLKRDGGAK